MTNQEIFTKVYQAILEQGHPSGQIEINNDGDTIFACKYRGPNGDKCAAGHMIPDEFYDPSFEGVNFHIIENKIKQLGFSVENLSLIEDLQEIHDKIPGAYDGTEELAKHWLKNWKTNMRNYAKLHDFVI